MQQRMVVNDWNAKLAELAEKAKSLDAALDSLTQQRKDESLQVALGQSGADAKVRITESKLADVVRQIELVHLASKAAKEQLAAAEHDARAEQVSTLTTQRDELRTKRQNVYAAVNKTVTDLAGLVKAAETLSADEYAISSELDGPERANALFAAHKNALQNYVGNRLRHTGLDLTNNPFLGGQQWTDLAGLFGGK